MNLKEIKELLQLMNDHELAEIEIEKDGLKVKLKKNVFPQAGVMKSGHELAPVIVPMPQTSNTGPATATASRPQLESPNGVIVKSPMVGTFYAAPGPDQPPFVSAGKKVNEGDVLCIIEAMKLMNEIKAEVSGEIEDVLVKNGQPIEFDQPLFRIRKE